MGSGKVSSGKSGLSAMVLKAMGLFGGLQVLGIVSSIVRSKLVALWIGPAGVGLFGLYNAALDMLASATQLNLRSSAVREIAMRDNDVNAVDVMVGVVRRWSWFLGLLGSVVVLLGAPLLSELTFGDESHVSAFLWLSVVMLLYSLTGGETAVLQGTRRLKKLAAASIWGTVAGTLLSIPLYYFYHLQSIVPSIIIFAAANLVAVLVVRYRTEAPVDIPLPAVVKKGRALVVLGAFLTVSAFATQLSSYIFMSYVNLSGGEEAVGYYQSGFTLVNRYLGLIFTALAMEYFPRLSTVSRSCKRLGVFVNHESGIVILAMMPAAILFIAFRELIVELFFTSQFAVIYDYISWGAAGSVLRGISWCMAYVILARGDGKLYLFTELLSCVFYLVFNFVAYSRFGIDGLGYAYFLWYLAYTIVVLAVCAKKYHITLSSRVGWLAVAAIALASGSALLVSCCYWLVLSAGILAAIFSILMLRRLF
ncbi:oligosaccharide flippase family protein [uncultured Muribaculum sp.]|uniref:oligosaccharide flippase family protein n=1 Tax=uncultured Muribaculum sp. TaxID=1918613 RepID=UPI002593097A|nr:oligosaccharide flippase family protein [uncultured Muribaculum sp.]